MSSGRYQPIEQLLVEGGMTTTLCHDQQTGAQVVVKLIDGDLVSSEDWRGIQRDLTPILSEASSSQSPVMDASFESTSGAFRIVSHFVSGPTLAARIARGGPLDLGEVLSIGRDISVALAHHHAAGVSHCAVAPGNIVITDDGGARLIDVGLARSAALAGAFRTRLTNRAMYIAPELTGLIERDVGIQVDLYSLGIVLFESVSGTLPFQTADFSATLLHHARTEPPSLRGIGIAVPRAFDDLVRQLLSKEPADRGDSAGAVDDQIGAIIQSLQQGVPEPAWSSTRATAEVPRRPSFVGRVGEFALLDRCLRDARHGASRLVVLEGESGIGKSRLMDAFCTEAAASGAWVLRGDARGRSTPLPLQLLSGVVDDVVSAMRLSETLASEVVARLGPDAPLLAMAVPELEGAFRAAGTGVASPGDGGRSQIVHALAALLGSLGSPERPAVVVLDDCQWADDISLQVIRSWQGATRLAGRSVIVIAAIRTESFPQNHSLREGDAVRMALEPLSRTQVVKLLGSMADDLPPETADIIISHARGNPLMVSALLWGLIESGALGQVNHDWSFRPGLVPIQVSRGAGAFLSTRLTFLSPGTHRVLSVAAVVGRTFDVDLIAAITGLEALAIRESLTDAEHRHLVWQLDDAHFGFSHDRLRETLLGGIERRELSQLHRAAALEIEATDPTRVFDLSFHYDAAEERDQALRCARVAAREARERFDLELAAHHLRIAERNTDDLCEFAILEELGELLILLGEYDAANERLVRARGLTSDIETAARIEGRLGDADFKRGDGAGSEAHLLAALSLLGRPVPATGNRYAWLLLREQGVRVIHRVGSLVRSRRVPDDGAGPLEAELLTRLAYAWWFNRRTLPALWLLTRQVNVAEARSSMVARGHAKAIYGAAITAVLPVLWRRGLRYTNEAERLHAKAGSRWGQGQALSMKAAVLHARGHFQLALDAATEAGEILEQTGDRWELSFVMWHRALCLYRLGRFDEAIDVARAVHQAGVEVGAAQAEAIGLELLAKIDAATVTAEVLSESLDHAGTDAHATASATQAKACRLRFMGRQQEALSLLQASNAALHAPAHMNVYLAPLVSWLATLERESAERADGDPKNQRRARVRRARRSSRRAMRSSWLYRPEAPRAYRDAALVAGLSGSTRRTRRLLRRSATIARRQGARVELALTQAAADRYGMPGLTAGDRLTRMERDAAARDAGGHPSDRPTLGLMSQFDALLDAGSMLASAGSQIEVAGAIAEACRHLLRAERCVVANVGVSRVEATDDIEGAPFADGGDLVHRAVTTRQPARLEPSGFEHSLRVSQPADGHVRSAICAPIVIDDDVVGWFIAASTQVDNFFGVDDERLARFIARLAAAALTRERLRRELRAGIIGAQEGERARIARDLHDELGQSLTSILLGLRTAQTAASAEMPDGSPVSHRLDGLRQDATEALASLHRLAFELRPLVLDDLGFTAALQRLVSGIQEKHGLMIEIAGGDLPGDERLPGDVETTAYRVTQEALTNIVRHASAQSASVLVAVARGHVRVVIEDDGKGFDAANPSVLGFGLRSMNERAALVGGTVRVSSVPGTGTTVVLDVPLD